MRGRYGNQHLTEQRPKGPVREHDLLNFYRKNEKSPIKNYIFAEVGPNRKPYNILVDSGACISITTEKVVEKERLQLLPLDPGEQNVINVANNAKLQISGKAWMDVFFDNVQISVLCYVVPELVTSILFGCDMLSEFDACINFAKQEVQLFNGQVSIPLTHKMRQNGVAYVKYAQTIPPRTERTITFRVSEGMKRGSKEQLVQIGPNRRVLQDSGLGVANVVAVVDHGWVKARVLNPWDHEVTLQRNKHYIALTEIKPDEIMALQHRMR